MRCGELCGGPGFAQGGKGTVCGTGKWHRGIVLYTGLLAESTVRCSFVWRTCGENTLRSYKPGICEVLMNVTSKHHPKPRKNVSYP